MSKRTYGKELLKVLQYGPFTISKFEVTQLILLGDPALNRLM